MTNGNLSQLVTIIKKAVVFHMLKKGVLLVFGSLFMTGKNHAQPGSLEIELLARLDSVSCSPAVSRHFATLYLTTTFNAVDFFYDRDPRTRELMERLEARFAGYFFRSVNAYHDKTPIPVEWKAYYEDPAATELSYILYGINAHINGDIWQALTTEFTLEEIRELKPGYFSYYKGLTRIYNEVYEMALSQSLKLRFLHTITLGLDRPYGRFLLAKWRRRQMRLAEWYYTNKPLFEKKKKKLERKKKHLDRLIRKNV